ncbi:hypothetical protein JCM10213v2_007471 [Rhodosporidiobolus nylandii]
MASDSDFPTPGQLVDKVPLIKNPGFWVPKPFVYPHTLESHVLSTLPSALQSLQQTHLQRLHLLASYAESKERARKARLNALAPGYAEGGAALEPVRKAAPSAAAPTQQPQKAEESLLGESDEGAPSTPSAAPGGGARERTGSFLGGPEFGSPKEAGAATLEAFQRDQMLDFVEGLERLDTTFGGTAGGKAGGEVDDLI